MTKVYPSMAKQDLSILIDDLYKIRMQASETLDTVDRLLIVLITDIDKTIQDVKRFKIPTPERK